MTRSHLQRDLAELTLGVEVRTGGDVELALLALDTPCGHFQVLPPEGVFNVLHRQLVGRQAVLIQPDAHGELALAVDLHVGHAGNGLQPGLDDAVDEIGDLQRRQALACEGQPDDRECICLDLGDDGLVNGGRQPPSHSGYAVPHVGGGGVGVLAQLEACGDLAALRPRDRGQDVNAVDARDGVFQRLGDLGFDDLRRGPEQPRVHGDHGFVDARVLAHRELGERNDPQQHEHHRHHRRENGASDGDF